MIEEKDIEPIGQFLKTHGLKGELNVQLDVDSDFINPDTPLIVNMDGIFVPFYPDSIRPKGRFSSLIRICGIDTEQKARQFVNKTIFALKSQLADFIGEDEDGDGEYAENLIGFEIFDETSDRMIGTIESVDYSTANVLFILEHEGETVYVPATADFITGFDSDNKIINMRLPDGLINLNTKEPKL